MAEESWPIFRAEPDFGATLEFVVSAALITKKDPA